MTFEQAIEAVRQWIQEHYPKDKDSDFYCHIGEVGDWWRFTACAPDGAGLTGAGAILVNKQTGETEFSCWPNALHPAERKHKYIPLGDGKPLKIHI